MQLLVAAVPICFALLQKKSFTVDSLRLNSRKSLAVLLKYLRHSANDENNEEIILGAKKKYFQIMMCTLAV